MFQGSKFTWKVWDSNPCPFLDPIFIVKSAILKFIYLSPTTVGNTPSENQRPKLYRMNAKLKIKTRDQWFFFYDLKIKGHLGKKTNLSINQIILHPNAFLFFIFATNISIIFKYCWAILEKTRLKRLSVFKGCEFWLISNSISIGSSISNILGNRISNTLTFWGNRRQQHKTDP